LSSAACTRALGARDLGLGGIALGAPRVEHRDARDVVLHELLGARELAARALGGGLACAREVALRARERHLIGARVDLEQQIALLHQLAVFEVLLDQVAAHARAHLDRVDRAHVADVLAWSGTMP
jgi:hypothetical protein